MVILLEPMNLMEKTKEGIYSLITQNERHKLVVKNMLAEGRNFIQMKLFNEDSPTYHFAEAKRLRWIPSFTNIDKKEAP